MHRKNSTIVACLLLVTCRNTRDDLSGWFGLTLDGAVPANARSLPSSDPQSVIVSAAQPWSDATADLHDGRISALHLVEFCKDPTIDEVPVDRPRLRSVAQCLADAAAVRREALERLGRPTRTDVYAGTTELHWDCVREQVGWAKLIWNADSVSLDVFGIRWRGTPILSVPLPPDQPSKTEPCPQHG